MTMRIFKGLLCWALFAFCFLQLMPTSAMADTAGLRSSLYMVLPIQMKKFPAPPLSYYDSPINGIYIQLLWNELQPDNAKDFDWTTLNRVLDVIKKSPVNKNISIGVFTGAYAPSWLEAEGASFVDLAIQKGGNLTCTNPLRFYVPWDDVYVQSYKKMMLALSRHLQDYEVFDRVKVVKLSLMGRISNELRLPSQNACGNDQAQAWIDKGYEPQKVFDAWRKAAFAVARYFPDAQIAQEIIGGNDFPMINDDGDPEADAHPEFDGDQTQVKDNIIRAGMKRLGNRFIVQWDSLNLRGNRTEMLDYYKAAGAKIAWQTNAWMGHDGAGCNDSRNDIATGKARICTEEEYTELLARGIFGGGQYIEVWPADVLRFETVIEGLQNGIRIIQ